MFQLGGFGAGPGGFFPGAGQKAAKRGTTGGKKCLIELLHWFIVKRMMTSV